MGITSDGQISFGILFEEDYEFPWYDDTEIENWWRIQQGYVNPFKIYTSDGNYINDIEPSSEEFNMYFNYRDKFDKAHPIPVFILAIPSTIKTCSRGYPEIIEPTDSNRRYNKDYMDKLLLEFCKTYSLQHENPPKWYLSSYLG